jgi:3-phenylpropionate/trans-cinnamate dioxygenase ferredoxin component
MGVTYVPVGRVGEVKPGEVKPIEIGGREALLVEADGSYFVCDRLCPHEAVDLATGAVLGNRIRCANHGYCFDLTTGACVMPPGGPPLTVLPVEVRGEEICVKLEW